MALPTMFDTTPSSSKTTDAKQSQLTCRLRFISSEEKLWDDRISRINEKIEEEKARFMIQKYSEYQEEIYHAQTSELFTTLMNTTRECLRAFRQLDEKWNANLCQQFGEARARALIKESRGQAMQEKVVLAMGQMAHELELEDPPKEEIVHSILSPTKVRPRSTASPQAQPLGILSSSLPTPPALERTGPSGLKRRRTDSIDPSHTRAIDNDKVGFNDLLFAPRSVSDALITREGRSTNRPSK